MFNLTQSWYRSRLTLLTFLLLPFSWIFGALVSVRWFLYKIHVKKSYRFHVPVIVVGNITVGGTGKTPFVIWLTQLLKQQGFKPGIVSRGVGGKLQRTPRQVFSYSDVCQMGDEAILLAEKSACPVVICIDRAAAVQQLLSQAACDVVISDDGLQHYGLQRDIEIALIDGMRGLGNQRLLPAGPLRERVTRLKEVDYVVRQGVAEKGEFGMTLVAEQLCSLSDSTRKKPLTAFSYQRVHAVAGIGNPARFFDLLKQYNMDIIEHVFPDHFLLQKKDIEFFDDLPIIMTEKDMVKCRLFANAKCWCVPVVAQVDERLGKLILENGALLNKSVAWL